MIAGARDHEVQLLWTVHDQFMLVHKSDIRDIWKDAQSIVGFLIYLTKFYNCLD
jgi:hypothetical protein